MIRTYPYILKVKILRKKVVFLYLKNKQFYIITTVTTHPGYQECAHTRFKKKKKSIAFS